MPGKTHYKDLLDYTISYKAVWSTIGVVFAFGVAGAIAYARMKPASEDEKARQEVKSAERLLQRAEGCAQQELKGDDAETLKQGKEALAAAQEALLRRRFAEAGASARDSQGSLKSFVDRVCATRDSVAEFVRIQGDVKVKKVQSPRWVPARKGQLAVGDRIWANDGVAVIVYKLNNEIQDIRPGSIIEIHDVFHGADGTAGTETTLEMGTMRMNSVPNSPSRIRSHDTTIEPGGDNVEVESPENSNTTRTTSLIGGAVVKHGGQTVTLERNTRVDAKIDAPIGAPVKSLESPEIKEPIEGRIFSTEKPDDKLVLFKWQPMPDAQGYKIEIARNDLFAPVLTGDDEQIASPPVELDLPPPNTYFWRVAAVDRTGVRGAWSEVRRFAVRGSVPDGASHPPPKIGITQKLEMGDRAIISGRTDQYVTLEVNLNGRKYTDVTVDEKGEFQVLVTLSQEGKNVIEFVAHDTYGQETRKAVVAHFTL